MIPYSGYIYKKKKEKTPFCDNYKSSTVLHESSEMTKIENS